MTEHAPKVAALEAYRLGALSDAGEERLERHLEGCASCRRTLAAMQAYDGIAEEVRGSPTPEVDWSTMELALRREAREQAAALRRRAGDDGGQQDPGGRRGLTLAVLAAAAVLAVVAAWPEQRAHQAETEVAPPALPTEVAERSAPPADAAEPRHGEVMAVLGTVTAERGPEAEAEALDVGATLAEGARIESAQGAEAHVRLGVGTGFVAHGDTALAIAVLDARAVELSLARGAVSSEVAQLEDDARYDVKAGPWSVRVRGTRFLVRRQGERLEVTVEEGTVEVARDGQVVQVLEAPATWASDETRGEAEPKVPRGLGPDAEDWPVLRLPARDEVARWTLPEPLGYEADDRIAMRVPADDVVVRALGHNGVWHQVALSPHEGELALGEAQLDALAQALTRAPQGHLDPAELRPVVREARPALKRCHERLMKQRPDIAGKGYRLQLRVTVGRSGVVQRTEVVSEGETPPAELEACIRQQLTTRAFPKPTGGPVTFEVPLTFQPKL